LRLGEAMVKEDLINNELLARALERQIIFGGRIGTNLVEMGAITEEELAKFLSKTLRVPYADPSVFEDIPVDAIDSMPAELAEKYTALPIKRDRGRLHLAMKDPNEIAILDELRFIVGLDIKPYIASEIRIIFGLEKYYGIKRDLRYISVLDEMREKTKPQAPSLSTSQPPQVKEDDYLGDESQADVYFQEPEAMPEPPAYQPPLAPQYTAPAPPQPAYVPPAPQAAAPYAPQAPQPPYAPPQPAYVPPPPAYTAPPPPAAPPLPMGVAQPQAPPAEADPYAALAAPADRDHIASAIVAAASRDVKRVVLLVLKGKALVGWKARGAGLTDEAVAPIVVSLDAPSIFKEVMDDKVYYKGPVLQVNQNTQFLVGLGGSFPQEAVAYPLMVKGKVVGALYGDDGQGALITGNVDRLVKLMGKASMSLEILILKNKVLSDD